jgi:hypothetical protein
MDDTLSDVKSVSIGRVLVSGTFYINGASAVASPLSGANWTVSKVGATTGKYKITLTNSAYKLISANAMIMRSGGTDYKIELDSCDTLPTTYVVFQVSSPSSGLAAAEQNAGLFPHQAPLAAASRVTAADSSDIATCKTLCQNLCVVCAAHDDDVALHVAADAGQLTCAAWASTPAVPADLTECQNVLNELKADWNLHRVKGPYGTIHTGDDAYSTIDAADASSQGTANTLANQLKLRINRSLAAAPTSVVVAAGPAAAVDPTTILVAFNLILANSDQAT